METSELEKLLVPGETHTDIIAGHCTCGEPYALIKGSNHTCYRNGDRMAHCADGEQGICYFRCTKCGGWLEDTFMRKRARKMPHL